ncbi:hypothetical protein HDU67_001755 [Dinochytrium kinnereticum]|nr:hypothetical protein HDU67_001755 [Dinochytrium kinnereticum]
MPNFQDVTLAIDGGIATITINREKTLNSMRDVTYQELRIALLEAANSKDAVITVVTGKGKYFSSGADVTAQRDPPNDPHKSWEHFQERLTVLTGGVTKAFIEHPKPLVVALNGPVVGFPAGVISLADVIYASESATLYTPFTSLGLCSEGGSSIGFTKRMGAGLASEALLFGRKFSAQELLSAGFVQRVFPDSQFHDEVSKILKNVVNSAYPVSLNVTKKLIRDNLDREYSRAFALELDVLTERFSSGDPANAFRKLMEIAAKKRAASSKL